MNRDTFKEKSIALIAGLSEDELIEVSDFNLYLKMKEERGKRNF